MHHSDLSGRVPATLDLRHVAGYVTEPLFGESNLSFRVEANYRGKEPITGAYPPADNPALRAASFSGEAFVLNARIALMHLPFAYGQGEVAPVGAAT